MTRDVQLCEEKATKEYKFWLFKRKFFKEVD
jgi:hypothetical protein